MSVNIYIYIKYSILFQCMLLITKKNKKDIKENDI